jgi:hypothetical protein
MREAYETSASTGPSAKWQGQESNLSDGTHEVAGTNPAKYPGIFSRDLNYRTNRCM